MILSSTNSFGSDVMAGNSAIVNLSGFVYLAMSAFYSAALSFSGQNFGAKKYKRIDQSMMWCLFYGLMGGMEVVPATLRGMKYSVGPTIVTLIGACALRIIWIETIFQIFRTPASLYVSNPISWGVTFAAHVVYYIIIRKKIVSLS